MKKTFDEWKKAILGFMVAMAIFMSQDYIKSFARSPDLYDKFVTVKSFDEFKSSCDKKLDKIDSKLDKLFDKIISGGK